MRVEVGIGTYHFLNRVVRGCLRCSLGLRYYLIVSPMMRTGVGHSYNENQKERMIFSSLPFSSSDISLTTRRTDFFDDSWSSPAMINSSRTEYAFWKLKILEDGQEESRISFPHPYKSSSHTCKGK